MRREGYIIEEIVAYPNMAQSFDQVLEGKRRKRSRQGRWLLAHREEVIAELSAQIADGSYTIAGGYRERTIIEGGKERRIQVLTMKDRIAVHAIMSIVDEHLKRRFIRTTSASIKGRGSHDLKAYIERNIREHPEETQFCYKFDISKFYESVSQQTIIDCVRRIFKDEKLNIILERFTRMMPTGVSIGLRSSQGLCNLLLSVHLDHILKDHLGIPFYYRYCDDGVVLAGSKEELWKIRHIIHECVESVGLKIKKNERIFPITENIDFLGYVIYPKHALIRKRIKKKFARKMGKVKSRKRRRVLIASFYGMAKHAQCNNLFYKLTGTEMRSFKDLNVAYKPDDGKKRFPGAVVSIRELVNLPIVIRDFEMGVKTSQGDDRCVVAIEQNGEQKKFFTNSEEMKNILLQVKEMPDGFPFETTIKAETFGKGKTKYVFT
ncbi:MULTISPECIES: reverse transcriptase domain-containing protein [Muribaculaceae]|uniref:reverse transcriptase domain-containing protein n=2 Tax=Bacteroidales TaxID=171549 RepID=UPI001C3DDA40|nr:MULTISPECIES: reverse transcriptase domain-containing protein [Muribaculaceae]